MVGVETKEPLVEGPGFGFEFFQGTWTQGTAAGQDADFLNVRSYETHTFGKNRIGNTFPAAGAGIHWLVVGTGAEIT